MKRAVITCLLTLVALSMTGCPIYPSDNLCHSQWDCAPGYTCDEVTGACLANTVGVHQARGLHQSKRDLYFGRHLSNWILPRAWTWMRSRLQLYHRRLRLDLCFRVSARNGRIDGIWRVQLRWRLVGHGRFDYDLRGDIPGNRRYCQLGWQLDHWWGEGNGGFFYEHRRRDNVRRHCEWRRRWLDGWIYVVRWGERYGRDDQHGWVNLRLLYHPQIGRQLPPAATAWW